MSDPLSPAARLRIAQVVELEDRLTQLAALLRLLQSATLSEPQASRRDRAAGLHLAGDLVGEVARLFAQLDLSVGGAS